MQSVAKSSKIGFAGVGRMGANMAERLNEQGWNVNVLFDRNPAAGNILAEETGASIAATLADVTELCDVVITVVSDDTAMQSIFAPTADSLLLNASGKLFINCATVSPQTHVDIERRCEERGAQALEACMAGSIPQARSGTLFLMCAGKREVFDRAEPLLRALGSNVIYTGQAGTAAQLKALVNMVMNVNTAGLAEGLGLAQALGLDLDLVRETFAKTGAASRVLETDGADMQARDHETYFSAAHAAKDSTIALQLARSAGLTLPLAQAAAAQYNRMVEKGLGDLDKSGIAELTFRDRITERESNPR
ncbi:MAG: NAD(P)-dependent oxidoreductase [Candidatus Eremiobacteraeota bacterium]|nr:NAD(P)-dependent oxidoreductase [Candidatus Eremiobacteraeota bacterium]